MITTEYGVKYISFGGQGIDDSRIENDRSAYTDSELNYERTVYRQVEEQDDELL